MTGAERQRRYHERLLASKQSDHALVEQLAQAHRRIAELEEKFTAMTQPQRQEWRKLSAQESRIQRLENEVRKWKAFVLPLDDGTQKDAVKQHKRAVNRDAKRFVKQMETFYRERAITMTSKDFNVFRAAMHPNVSEEMQTEARIRFESLYKKRVIRRNEP